MQNIPIMKHYTKVFSNADALDDINLIKGEDAPDNDNSSSNDDGSSGSSDSDKSDSDSEDT